MPAATIEIPQEIMDSARLSTAEIKQEIALSLYAHRRLSIGKARELAGLSLWEFRQLLGTRRIAPHFDRNDLAEDLTTLEEWDETPT
jgi:predicted HTH domain antitoxin